MGMAAAAWDMVAKAANLAQMSGLHAAMLVAVLTSLLRIQQCNKRECARLELCHRRLQRLLQWSVTGCGSGFTLLLSSEMGDPFGKALDDAANLVESYKKSTLWRRVRGGGRMATQLRDMHNVVDSYSGLLLFVNAQLLLQQHAAHPHGVPPSTDTSITSTTVPEMMNDDTSHSPSAETVTSRPAVTETGDDQRASEGGINTDPAGCERNVPALLPIVISYP